MRYILNIINMPNAEVNVDKEFPTMEELTEYVTARTNEWTSLVITILPT